MYILFDLPTSLNQEPIMMSLKVCTVAIEKYSRSYTKINRLHDTAI